MQELLEQFKASRAALLAATGKRPNRYPDTLREIAVAYSKEAQANGIRHRAVAENLGIDPITLAAWERKSGSHGAGASLTRPAPKLQRVEVVDDVPVVGNLCVVGPHGLRIEGMSMQQVAELFQRLAC